MDKNEKNADLFTLKRSHLSIIGLLIILFLVSFGLLRFYTGSDIGLRIVSKESFSFKDTFVNIDDIIGMPRIAATSQHPQVVRQLAEMGIVESEEAAKQRIEEEVQQDYQEAMDKAEQDAIEMQNRINQQMNR